MVGFGFTGREKLKKTDEFSSVFNFRKRIHGSYLSLHYMPNTLGHARLGIIVGRKTARRAVQRNYMKRLLRELFRLAQPQLPAADILARPQRAFTRAEYAMIRQEFLRLLEQLRERTGGKPT